MDYFTRFSVMLLVCALLLTGSNVKAQFPEEQILQNQEALMEEIKDLSYQFDVLEKAIDDVMWHKVVGDVAYIDKLFMAGARPRDAGEATTLRGKNPIKFWTYVFIPKDIDPSGEYPLLVFPHGGVHGDFNTYYTHIIRELMAQQYIVVAPEYRGSTGYGKGHHQLIDYGGLENEDVYKSMELMVENYDMVDSDRVGLIGWSHGGMISLMNAFENPDDFEAVFAGVPVSDLIARMGYKRPAYENDWFAADHHIGKGVHEDMDEYRRRSPVFHAHKLDVPLLIHTNTIDEDVHVLEVENLINTLKAHDKDFEYRIYEEIPGGHSFDRMDHRRGREIRFKIYEFMGQYLNPPRPFDELGDMEKAAYRF